MMINLVPECQAIMIITSSKPINPTVTIKPQGWIGILVSVECRTVSWRYHDWTPNLLEGNVDGMEPTSAPEQHQAADRLKTYIFCKQSWSSEVCRRRFYRLRHDTVILSITKLVTKGHDNVGSKTRSKDKRTSYQSYRDNDVSLFSRGRDGLMSLTSPSDGRERSG